MGVILFSDDPEWPDPIIEDDERSHNHRSGDVCVLCLRPLYDDDEIVSTGKGLAHEDCAEDRWPLDPGDTRYPR